jgi:hypothetical protein
MYLHIYTHQNASFINNVNHYVAVSLNVKRKIFRSFTELGSVSAFRGNVDFPAIVTCRRSCRICTTRVNDTLIAVMQGEVTYTCLESNGLQWSIQIGGFHSIVSECTE